MEDDLGYNPYLEKPEGVVIGEHNNVVMINQPGTRARLSTQKRQNRQRMLTRLHLTYQDILHQSLQGAFELELELILRPDVVQNPTSLLIHNPRQVEQSLPVGTTVSDVYKQVNQELLILGAPGAGKTILLLSLAQQLVEQAIKDETQPLPVLLPLCSWAARQQTLQDWLGEQLTRLYDVPTAIALHWIKEGSLLFLLDGLDEMPKSARPACVSAINFYHRTHMGPLVVCSRWLEYQEIAQQQRLFLQSAVLIRALSLDQIEAYLTAGGEALRDLHTAFAQYSSLQELATTPLMLNVLARTYSDTSVEGPAEQKELLEQQVWASYIRRMVEQKGDPGRYVLSYMCTHLQWLARQMRTHNQVVFYLEYLQPDWLTTFLLFFYRIIAVYLPAALIGMLVSLLLVAATYFSLSPFHIGMLLDGGLLGVVLCNASLSSAFSSTTAWRRGLRFLLWLLLGILLSTGIGCLTGIGIAEDSGYSEGFKHALLWGLCSLVLWCLPLKRFQTWGATFLRQTTQPHFLGNRSHFATGLLVAVVVGLVCGSVMSLLYKGYEQQCLGFGLFYGFILGSAAYLLDLFLIGIGSEVHLVDRVNWSWKNLRDMFSVGYLSRCLVGAILLGTVVGLTHELIVPGREALRDICSRALSIGIAMGLLYWLSTGLYRGVAHEIAENHHRITTNQGITRSLWNGLTLGLICAIVVGTLGGLYDICSFCLSASLHVAKNSMWGDVVVGVPTMGLSIGLLAFLLNGGLAAFRHYVLRILLWSSGAIPWDYTHFLDIAAQRVLLRKIGGGYTFHHQLLRDYFIEYQVPLHERQAGAYPLAAISQTREE